jgi:ferredoxin/truncated hemoglobin YjbI
MTCLDVLKASCFTQAHSEKMPTISYGERQLATHTDETLLQACTRQGISLRSSCRGGVCQTCVMRCVEGMVPTRAQSGLNEVLVAKGYFMHCVCKPTSDMVIEAPLVDDFFVPALLAERQEGDSGITFLFEPLRSLPASSSAVVVRDAAGHKTRFALCTQPEIDYYFGIHLPSGDGTALGRHWRTTLQVGDQIEMREALDDEVLDTEEPSPLTAMERPIDPPHDLELWAALSEGALLRPILQDFYARVYADPQLAPFFVGVTQQRLVEKQYSFLHQILTGSPVFFGSRPRNAHHWMVISDALFDHREQIMRDCLNAHGLAEKWVERLLHVEGHYRQDIVKSAPVPLQIGGVDFPLDGFDELPVDVGSLCDGCGGEIAPGSVVRYHRRLGTMYCAQCQAVPSDKQRDIAAS